MFFPKLRRHAKWVFLFLAVAFALGFVGFGVGAGGVGVGELFRGSSGTSGVPSVSDAQERVNENPKDAKAYRDLANAYQAEGETALAIEALEGFIDLRPKNDDALRQLASLYQAQVRSAQEDYQIAELRTTFLAPTSSVLQGITLDGKPLALDPISTAVGSTLSEESNAALSAYQQASTQLVATYRRLAVATPDDPTIQQLLAKAALDIGDVGTAVAAYEAYLRFPGISDVDKREIQRIIKQLQAQTAG
jgi:tetratricopeptide (TPR) repeat protein